MSDTVDGWQAHSSDLGTIGNQVKIFVTGASGYIGGSVAAGLINRGHQICGLVRSDARAEQVRQRGIEPVLGQLSDLEVLARMASECDAVINAANAEDRASAETFVKALAGSGKAFLQTSGSSVLADLSEGKQSDAVYDEDTAFTPLPGRAPRVAVNQLVLDGASQNLRSVVIAPTLIYGRGHGVNPSSIQVPWLIELAKQKNCAHHIGPGENIWANVHIDDLVDLYALALEKAPAGAFYYAENGENSMREICQTINNLYRFSGTPQSMTVAEAAKIWGEGAANYTMGSNSRARAKRARQELGWSPSQPSLLEDLTATGPI